MTLQIRRVVTGHDPQGKSVVKIDEIASNRRSIRKGHEGVVVWTTDSTPANISGDRDGADWHIHVPPILNGSIFRITEYSPGVASHMHRTDSIDYVIVMSGEIDMGLDDGTEVHLKAGDVMVQRGTYHDSINRGDVPCVIAFIFLDGKR
jgi:mannose-6-phosphate isomerase-like protein (cupin superfamily)